MPPPSKSGPGAHSRPAPTADPKQIATSNATASTFLGGRQPSWLNPSGPVTKKPTSRRLSLPRPPATLAVQHQLQQPAVLPSPAPSDEPSPALSSTLESPKTIPSTLPDAHAMVFTTPFTAAPAPAPLPVTTARFGHIPAEDLNIPDIQEISRPSSVASALHVPVSSPSMARPPLQPLVDRAQNPRQDRHNRTMSFDGGSVAIAPHPSAPSLKRRRTDIPPAAPSGFSSLLPALEQYVRSRGGEDALEPTLEKPRVVLLREACLANDEFFVLLHQLFCMWSLNPYDAHESLRLTLPTEIDAGFTVLGTVLRKNQHLAPQTQQWFSRFPLRIEEFTQQRATYPPIIFEIARFLAQLATRYDELDALSMQRRYPFLVDELLSRLGCYSPILQKILFTACRRRLGVVDGPLGASIEHAFHLDQNRHRNEVTGTLVLTPFTYQGEIEKRNSAIISRYREIVQAAAPMASGHQPNLQSPTHVSTPSPLASHQQLGPPSIQIAQQSQPVYSPHSMTNLFPPVYPSTALPVPSQVPTMLPNPYAPDQGQSQPETGQTTSLNTTPLYQQFTRTGPVFQHRGPSGSVLSPQGQVLPSQYLANQQLKAPQQAVLQQINRQQYHQNAQRTRNLTLHTGRNLSQFAENLRQQHVQHIQQAQPLASPARYTPHTPTAVPSPAASVTALQAQQGAFQRQRTLQTTDPLLPSKGVVITRPEWPHGPSDRKAIMMSLHQAHVRSPKRVMKNGETERFYQAVKSLLVGPTSLRPKNSIYEFRFEVTEQQFAVATLKSKIGPAFLPVAQHFTGALRWRLRCCLAPGSSTALSEPEWATLDVSWPTNIFMTLNDQTLDVRRQSHNGKDLATEITDFIICGTNILKIGVPDMQKSSSNNQNRFMAVELLETLSHSTILNHVWSHGLVSEEHTLATIKKRLTSSLDDDVAFEAPDLAIDLADPFSSTIFAIPARGIACTHMECFDLETWLETRPAKKSADCTHGNGSGCACPNGKREPSNPDRWRCPICSKDARPYSLRIDGFLLGVRQKLEKEGKLSTKSMRVKADGTWSVVLEEEDDGGSDGEEPAAKRVATGVRQAVPGTVQGVRREVEVIEID